MKFLVVFLFVVSAFCINAQQVQKLKGRVINEEGLPLKNVVIKGRIPFFSFYCVTDSAGYFEFETNKDGSFLYMDVFHPVYIPKFVPLTSYKFNEELLITMRNKNKLQTHYKSIKRKHIGSTFKKVVKKYNFDTSTLSISVEDSSHLLLASSVLGDSSIVFFRLKPRFFSFRKGYLYEKVIGIHIETTTNEIINYGKIGTQLETINRDKKQYTPIESKVVFYDTLRKREIPSQVYQPKGYRSDRKQKVVIISHGYGHNNPTSYLGYSFIANDLASKGYFVVSILHELPTDDTLAMTGVLQVTRRPNWERGVQNIDFVLNEIGKRYPYIDTADVTLIGHSNGGDISMLYDEKFPSKVNKVISLDHRRMPIPLVGYCKVYSLRSCDANADEGVLPTFEEQFKSGIVLVKLPDVKHNDMCNAATKEQQELMLMLIRLFLF